MSWNDSYSDTCGEQNILYFVNLNGEDNLHLHLEQTSETFFRVLIGSEVVLPEGVVPPGEYNISVVAVNNKGEESEHWTSSDGHELVYNIRELTPPSEILSVIHVNDDKMIFAEVTWEEEDVDSMEYLVTISSPDQDPVEKTVTEPRIQVMLSETHPAAEVTVQAVELGKTSSVSVSIKIFRFGFLPIKLTCIK